MAQGLDTFARRIRRWIAARAPYGLRVAFLGAWLAVAGCGFITVAHVTVNDPINTEDVAFILPGETTFWEVVDRLGVPDELVGSDGGAVIAYHFRDVKYSRVNFGWPLRFWSPVQPDFIFSGAGLGTDVFEVAFNQRWIVQYHAFAKHVPPMRRYNPWPF